MSPGSMRLEAAEAVAPADRLDTLPRWDWDILDPAAPRTLGWHAIAWGEGPTRWDGFPGLYERGGLLVGWRGLTTPNGPRAAKPWRYTERQRTFLLWFYALDDDAQWIYDGGVRRLAKGSGKSPYAGAHALTEYLGPVRLASFRDGAPGGCEARPVELPLVHIAATAESQTANTMRMVRALAPKRSHVAEYYQLDPGKTIYYRIPEGTLEVITSSFTAAEGAEESFVVKDELEHWKPSNGGPTLSATIDDNLAKSGARSLGTCNAWEPGHESVAESDWDSWLLEQEGAVRDEAGRILYDAVISRPKVNMSDPGELRAELERIYEDCDWKKPHEPDPDRPGDLRPVPGSKPNVTPTIRRIYNPKSSPADSWRKYLNRPTAAEDAWCSPEEWTLLADPTVVVAPGDRIAAFFDGSKSGDATALIGCRISDGHVFTLGIWEPGTNRIIDAAAVDLAVADMFDTYDVAGYFSDVREWESFAKVSWPEAYADQLDIMAVPSGKDPQAIAWDMRTKLFTFTTQVELVAGEIDEQAFTHDANPTLARHVANARIRANRFGESIGKESPKSDKKIDGCVSMIGARMVRRLVLAAEPERKTGDRVVGWR